MPAPAILDPACPFGRLVSRDPNLVTAPPALPREPLPHPSFPGGTALNQRQSTVIYRLGGARVNEKPRPPRLNRGPAFSGPAVSTGGNPSREPAFCFPSPATPKAAESA